MRAPRRTSILLVSVVALLVAAVGCRSYVDPPALAMSNNVNEAPFFTMSRQEMLDGFKAEQGKSAQGEAGAPSSTTTTPESYPTEELAAYLNQQVEEHLLEKQLQQYGVVVTDLDRQLAESQQQATDPAAREQAISRLALMRTLGEQKMVRDGIDPEKAARELYDQNLDRLTQPAEVCLHVIELTAPSAAQQQLPTEAELAELLARAQAAKARLATETFEAVADDLNRGQQGAPPGGDVGCVGEDRLPPAALEAIAALSVGVVSDPIELDASYALVRVDGRNAAVVTPFDEVRDQALQSVALSLGQEELAEANKRAAQSISVVVDPRFGVWDVASGTVQPPPGAATPSVPTTPTTAFDLGQLGGVPVDGGPAARPNTP